MIEEKIKKLRKLIIYRVTHTGTKETDILFNQIIVENITKLDLNELEYLKKIFDNFTDNEIFLMIIKKKYKQNKIKKIFAKLSS